MISSIITEGTKVDIRMVSQVERSQKTGEDVHIYKSQIYGIKDNGELEMIMPTEGGRIILLPLGIRFEFVFYTNKGLYKSIGQIKERYKTENKYMLRIELNTQLSRYQRREYYRLECIIDMKYMNISAEMAKYDNLEDIIDELRNENFYENQKKAAIVDISGGGVRFISDEINSADSDIIMIVNLDNGVEENQYYLVGHIIQCTKLEVQDRKYENRVEFILKDSKVRDEIIKFIFAEERRTRKNEKG